MHNQPISTHCQGSVNAALAIFEHFEWLTYEIHTYEEMIQMVGTAATVLTLVRFDSILSEIVLTCWPSLQPYQIPVLSFPIFSRLAFLSK